MAFGSVASIASGNNKSSSATWNAATLSAQLDTGNAIVLILATDNISGSDAETTDHTGVSIGALTLGKAAEWTNSAGSCVSIWYGRAASNIASGTAINTSYSASVTAKALTAWEFTAGADLQVDAYDKLSTSANGQTVSLSSLANSEHLFVRGIACESTVGTLTPDGGYAIFTASASSGGGAATNQGVMGEWDIATATSTSTSAADNRGAGVDRAILLVSFSEAAGGTTTPQALTATATTTGLVVKQVNKLASATATSTATMQRQTSKNVSATSTTTASIRKQVTKALSATATSTASLVAVKVILKALTATATSTASLARSVLKNLSVTSTATATVQRQANKTLSATSATTASLQALKVIVKALTATATVSASLSKRVNKSLSATVTSTPSMVKTVLKNLSATATSTATLQALRVVLKALTATVTTSASIARQVQFHFSATAVAAGTLTKVVQKRVSASVATTASMLTDIFLAGAEPIVRFFKGTLGGGTGRGTPSGGTGPGSPGGSFFDDAPPGDH